MKSTYTNVRGSDGRMCTQSAPLESPELAAARRDAIRDCAEMPPLTLMPCRWGCPPSGHTKRCPSRADAGWAL